MDARQLFVFRIGEQQLALPLDVVESAARMVEFQSLPGAPENVLGVVNFHGRIIPVISLRAWLRLEPQPMSLRGWLIIAHLRERSVALAVDAVEGVWQCDPRDIAPAESVSPDLHSIEGVLRRDDGQVVICDLSAVLSPHEQRSLEEIAVPVPSEPVGPL